jgi:hypothetical protein
MNQERVAKIDSARLADGQRFCAMRRLLEPVRRQFAQCQSGLSGRLEHSRHVGV